MPKTSPSLHRRGFSVQELLLATALVAVLATLLISQMQGARKRAQNVECVARLKQIGLGLHQYIADHQGYLLPGAVPEYPYRSWYNVLDAYMGGTDLDFASGNRPAWTQCPARKFPSMTEYTVGYGWNFAFFGFGHWEEAWAGGYNSRLVSVAEPSQTIIIGDSTDLMDNELMFRLLYPGTNPDVLAARHFGKGNYLFLDGRVSAFTPQELFQQQHLFRKIK